MMLRCRGPGLALWVPDPLRTLALDAFQQPEFFSLDNSSEQTPPHPAALWYIHFPHQWQW